MKNRKFAVTGTSIISVLLSVGVFISCSNPDTSTDPGTTTNPDTPTNPDTTTNPDTPTNPDTITNPDTANSDILNKSADELIKEDCEWLEQQYNLRNEAVEALLSSDPASTPHGERCIELDVEI